MQAETFISNNNEKETQQENTIKLQHLYLIILNKQLCFLSVIDPKPEFANVIWILPKKIDKVTIS